MRGAFVRALTELAQRDERIFLAVGDLGFGVVEDFAARFPEQFLNVGVAEQNLTGIAAGLALSGKIVFTYSIANFPILRCLEQIRNDVCYHLANVKIVSVGGGLAYGALGPSHHATEDLAIMRSLPQMAVVAPGDPQETEAATHAIALHPGPCYLRLGRAGESRVHQSRIDFQLGRALQVSNGDDLTLISTGGMLQSGVRIVELLQRHGLKARLLSMHTVKPLDTEAALSAALETGAVFTLEEHSVTGGLGSAVAEVLAESEVKSVTFKRFGLPSSFCSCAGSQEYLRAHYGLSPEAVAEAISSILERTRSLAVAANG
jgi:transketolase